MRINHADTVAQRDVLQDQVSQQSSFSSASLTDDIEVLPLINRRNTKRLGITRLDSYYDPNERKYYITPQSVEAAIQEEIQRANKSSEPSTSEPFGSSVAHVKHFTPEKTLPPVNQKVQELEREVQNLKIANEVKDKFIELMKNERNGFMDKLITANRVVGQLETKLNQLEAPKT